MCVDHLPFGAVFQSVANLIFGLEQDVLELGGVGPADRQLVLEVADTTRPHVGRRVCGHCKNKRLQCVCSRCTVYKARTQEVQVTSRER